MAEPQSPIQYDKTGNPIKPDYYDGAGNPVYKTTREASSKYSPGVLGGLYEAFDPVAMVKGAYDLATGKALNDVAVAGFQTGAESRRQFDLGNYTEAGNTLLRNMPVLGPYFRRMEAGDTSGAVAYGAGMIAPSVLGEVVPRNVNVGMKSRTPEVAKAMDFAMKEGVPLGAAKASGSPALNRVSYAADTGSVAGLMDWERGVISAYEKLGKKVASGVEPTVAGTTPQIAGSKMADSMRRVMQQHADDANTAYGEADKIAEQYVQSRPVTRTEVKKNAKGKNEKVQVTRQVDMAVPIDMSTAKKELAPILDELDADPNWTLPRKEADPGYQALSNLVNGDDFVPLSRARKLASAIGRLQEGSGKTGIRKGGEGLAAYGYGALADAIDEGIAAIGADAPKLAGALKRGAEATKAKWSVDTALGRLGQGKNTYKEGLDAFRPLLEPHDANINQLADVQSKVPELMPELGRAALEERLTKMFENGSLEYAKTTLNWWNSIGQKTKNALYSAESQKNITDLLVSMDTYAKSANPSGSGGINATMGLMRDTARIIGPTMSGAATVGVSTVSPWAAIGYQLIASGTSVALHSPRLARLLVRDLTIPTGPIAQAAGMGGTAGIVASQSAQTPTVSSATAPPKSETPAENVPAVVKAAGPGTHTLSDGTVWKVSSDGTITKLK